MKCALVLWALGTVMALAETNAPTAEQIVEKMADVYATCGTYQDEGVITFVSNRGSTSWNNDRPFRILCNRFGGTNDPSLKMFPYPPKFLRFEFSLKTSVNWSESKYVLWVVGGHARSYWEALGSKSQEFPNLTLAVQVAVGTSGSCLLQSVPELLIDNRQGRFLAQMAGVSLVGGETVEGQDCYVITGQIPRRPMDKKLVAEAGPFRMWIGKNDYLLRKQQCSLISSNGDSHVSLEIHRYIKLNEPIPESAFEFVPPKGTPGEQSPAP